MGVDVGDEGAAVGAAVDGAELGIAVGCVVLG